MKRVMSALLCVALLLTLSVPALADDEPAAESLRRSEYCVSAPMAANYALFSEAESAGLDAALTRGMAALILYRISGDVYSSTGHACTDVQPGEWYAEAADWASASGVLPAAEGDLFLPDEPIDRQTLCMSLERFLSSKEWTAPAINESYYFLDSDVMLRALRNAAGMLQQAGILIECDDGCFHPDGTLTVEEGITVFLRLIGSCTAESFLGFPVSSVAESEAKDDSWFEDVCFIGHSQVAAMQYHYKLKGIQYLAEVGFKAPDMLVHKAFHYSNGEEGSLKNLLGRREFGKIYVLLGVNDFSEHKNRIDEFKASMRQIIDILRETQPNARIYLLSPAPIGRTAAYPTIYNAENARLYSQALKDLSREYGTEYLDIFRLLCDSSGYLRADYATGDGIHLMPPAYAALKEYLLCHTGV